MSEALPQIPRKVLIAAGAMIALSIAMAAVGRITGFGRLENPVAEPVRTVEVRFDDAEDGGVLVNRADGRRLMKLAPGTNGFIRGVMRSLVRQRRLDRIEADIPFRITQWSDHRLTIDDPATGESVELTGFGKDNRAAFARLLAANATMAPGRQP